MIDIECILLDEVMAVPWAQVYLKGHNGLAPMGEYTYRETMDNGPLALDKQDGTS